MDYTLLKGSTSVILTVDMRLLDGAPATGLAATGVTCAYLREGSAAAGVAVVLAAGVAGVYGSGHWVETDPSGLPGVYQLGIPDAALAAGARSVLLRLSATGCFARTVQVRLTATNPDDGVRQGLTALPNAVAGVSGGVPVLSAGLEVAATIAAPVALTAAYDAAKTAASATALSAVSDAVAAAKAVLDDLHDTDLPAVAAAVTALGLVVDGLVATVEALENVSASEASAAVLAAVVDGAQTVTTVLRRLNAVIAGKASVALEADSAAVTYYRADGVTAELVATSDADGRTVV